MSNRLFNVFFHLHTVSGLVISVALFVIFFAGSISFFRDDIINWERQQPIGQNTQMDIDYDIMLDTMAARNQLYGRNITLRQFHQERRMMVSMTPSKDTTAIDEAKSGAFFYQDPKSQENYSYFEDFTLGEFIYRLHFFAQIPYPYGYFFAGIVAFFFLFAVITGVVIHWKHIVQNFYVFRPWVKLKNIWTDAHTALGLIGLPFQFLYALTGAILIIGYTVMLYPATTQFYDGNAGQYLKEASGQLQEASLMYKPVKSDLSLNKYVAKVEEMWPNAALSKLEIWNYGDESMRLLIEAKPDGQSQFAGLGQALFNPVNDELLYSKSPDSSANYYTTVQDTIIKLHYGNFGGYGVRIIYFIFGIITCFVIISGVLIWVEARNKKSISKWKRKSNEWVAAIFLAVSLSLYPVTAISFVAVKLFKDINDPQPHVFIFKVFFLSWLLLSLFFSVRKNNYITNKYTLLIGSLIGILVPIANGIKTGKWFWDTFNPQQHQLFVVDFFWLSTSAVALFVVINISNRTKNKDKSIAKNKSKKTSVLVAEKAL